MFVRIAEIVLKSFAPSKMLILPFYVKYAIAI
jgi:hypothetical protein